MRTLHGEVDESDCVETSGDVKDRVNFTIPNMSLSGMLVDRVDVDKLINDDSIPEP